jgi:hypothetical protein
MRWYQRRRRQAQELVNTSQLACYTYCPEAWRLHDGLGVVADNQADLVAGRHYH